MIEEIVNNTSQNSAPMETQAPSVAPDQPAVQAAPMVSVAPEEKKGKGIILGAVAIIVILLLLILSAVFIYKKSISKVASISQQNNVTQTQVSKPTETPIPTPTTVPVSKIDTSSDMNSVYNEVNSTNTTEIQDDLNKATTESSNF